MRIYKALSFIVLLGMFSQVSHSQDATFNSSKEKPNNPGANITSNGTTLLIVPFELKMYDSELDEQFYKNQGYSTQQSRTVFRKGIANNTFIESKHQKGYASIVLLGEDPEIMKDLLYVHNSIGYKYDFLPVDTEEKEETRMEQMLKKVNGMKKQPEEQQKGKSGIYKGEVYTPTVHGPRYMDTRITNPNMMSYLQKTYGCSLMLFINQMDLKISSENSYAQFESEIYKREVTVHYTIMDMNGEKVYGGMATEYFSSVLNDPKKIIKLNFGKLAEQMVLQLPDLKEELPQANTQSTSNFQDITKEVK